jgi:hypothetical protein
MASKVTREFEERDILLAHGMLDSNRGPSACAEAHDGSPRSAQLALQRMHLFGWRVETSPVVPDVSASTGAPLTRFRA